MNIKTEVVMASVQLGYNTLLVDGDMVFLQDPMPHLQGNYDLHIQVCPPQQQLEAAPTHARTAPHLTPCTYMPQDDDKGGRNSGFMMLKATPWALAFLGRSLALAQQAKNMRQQVAVNKALDEMKRKPLTVKVSTTICDIVIHTDSWAR